MIKIEELALPYHYNNETHFIYPTLIIDNNDLTLVDTGYPQFMPMIEQRIIALGYKMNDLKNIIITHYDDDHIGSLFDFKVKYPHLKIMASAIEKDAIEGTTKSERLLQAEKMLEVLPDTQKEFGQAFIKQLTCLKHVQVDTIVSNGDCILSNECVVISTPGHTSGHISLHIPALKTVITGDAAIVENNELKIANPHFCLDIETAQQSLHSIKHMDVERYYCYHGGKIERAIITNK